MSNKRTAVVNIENEDEYIKWCKSLKVDSKREDYVSLIIDHSKEIEKRKSMDKEKYKEYLPFEIQYKLKYERHREKRAVLNIDVSDKQSSRAYKFMNCFIEAIQSIGGYISVDTRNSDNTLIRFPYCTFECSLVEKRGKYRDVKPLETRSMRPSYEIIDTGKLIFKIYTTDSKGISHNEQIYDEESIQLKEQISDVFINLRPLYIDITKSNIETQRMREKEDEERYRKWELKWEEEKAETENKKQQELLRKQQSDIEQHIEKWNYINQIDTYILGIKTYAQTNQSEEKKEILIEYCDYVESLFNKNVFLNDIIKFTNEKIMRIDEN